MPRGLTITVSPRHSWTEETSLRSFRENADVDIGILVSGLFLLDFDSMCQYDTWAADHREIASAPAERTKTGMRVYFLRCPRMDAAELYNGPLVDPYTCDIIGVRRITISPSGAPNLIVCSEWMSGRSILDCEPPTMSSDLLRKIVRYSESDYYVCNIMRPRAFLSETHFEYFHNSTAL